MDAGQLAHRIRSEYANATQIVNYKAAKSRFTPTVTHSDAAKFIHQCNTSDVGFLTQNTRFNKETRDALVECVKGFSKAVALAIYMEIYENIDSIMTGALNDKGGCNINEFTTKLIAELTSSNRKSHGILKRPDTTKNTSYIFFMIEVYFSNPYTTPITVEFLNWMDCQPLNSLSSFIYANFKDIIKDIRNATSYIMTNFDAKKDKDKWALFDIINGTDNGCGERDYSTVQKIRERVGEEAYAELINNEALIRVEKKEKSAPPKSTRIPPTQTPKIDVTKEQALHVNAPAFSVQSFHEDEQQDQHDPQSPNIAESSIKTLFDAPPWQPTMFGSFPKVVNQDFQIIVSCSCTEEASELLAYATTLKHKYIRKM